MKKKSSTWILVTKFTYSSRWETVPANYMYRNTLVFCRIIALGRTKAMLVIGAKTIKWIIPTMFQGGQGGVACERVGMPGQHTLNVMAHSVFVSLIHKHPL